jgi:predicted ester cyclase
MPSPQQTLETARAAWNAGDLDGYLQLYDDAIVLHGYDPDPMDRTGVRGFYEAIFAGFDSPQLEFHDVLWDRDQCAIRFTMSGRHVGPFHGIEATGQDVALPGITILRFNDAGRCAERWSRADFLGLMMQLGAIPAPA